MDVTKTRKTALEEIAAERVTFDYRTAQWQLDGKPQGGWKGRTYAELWSRWGCVNRPEPRGKSHVVNVRLTKTGKDALKGAQK